MSTIIQTRRQTVRVSGTTKVTVSARADSETAGQRLRAIRIHTDDPSEPALTIEIEGPDDAAIALPTPEGTF